MIDKKSDISEVQILKSSTRKDFTRDLKGSGRPLAGEKPGLEVVMKINKELWSDNNKETSKVVSGRDQTSVESPLLNYLKRINIKRCLSFVFAMGMVGANYTLARVEAASIPRNDHSVEPAEYSRTVNYASPVYETSHPVDPTKSPFSADEAFAKEFPDFPWHNLGDDRPKLNGSDPQQNQNTDFVGKWVGVSVGGVAGMIVMTLVVCKVCDYCRRPPDPSQQNTNEAAISDTSGANS